MIGLPVPLLPIQLLWINLVTDGLPALCPRDRRDRSDVMRRHPRARAERITESLLICTRLLLAGGMTAMVCFGVFLGAWRMVRLPRNRPFNDLHGARLL